MISPKRSVADQAVALIAIRSDQYASRRWCRREILEAKRAQRPIVVVTRVSRR